VITADTITAELIEDVFHALSEAAEKSRRTMRLAQQSDITPALAAESLNAILSRLKTEIGRIR